MQASPKYLRRKDAAAYLRTKYGVGATSTLEKLASTGGGPEFSRVGGAAIYEIAELDRWMEGRKVRMAATQVVLPQDANPIPVKAIMPAKRGFAVTPGKRVKGRES